MVWDAVESETVNDSKGPPQTPSAVLWRQHPGLTARKPLLMARERLLELRALQHRADGVDERVREGLEIVLQLVGAAEAGRISRGDSAPQGLARAVQDRQMHGDLCFVGGGFPDEEAFDLPPDEHLAVTVHRMQACLVEQFSHVGAHVSPYIVAGRHGLGLWVLAVLTDGFPVRAP